ncbi:FAD-dependent oxidoreductase [Streptomyces sp. M10(2022)]
MERTQALAAMAERELDVLVVGAGVVGAGTALDAATRGLSTGLVEARDWASGTSSRSSKLIHGGLRYLEMLDFTLVREALKERGLLLERLAPHLVKPVPFLYPLQHKGWERLYAGSGVALYDAMSVSSGHGRGLPVHRHLSRRRALRVAPALKRDALVGALQYYDAQMDDARYVATLVRTAAGYGAQVANRARVTGFLREGERVVGARVQDVEGGGEYEVRARQVVNATGVWTDDTQALIGERGQFHVRASKGIHLVVPRTGSTLDRPDPADREVRALRHPVGAALDRRHDGHRLGPGQGAPAASSADIDYLLEHVNSVLNTPLTRDDVEGSMPGCGRCWPVSRTRRASCRASTPSPIRCPVSWSSRAASTRRTG